MQDQDFNNQLNNTCNEEIEKDRQTRLATSIMSILDNWKLSGDDILNVLALPKTIKVRHLGKFRKSHPFPDLPEVNERIRHIIGITKALQTSYPRNPLMASFWLNNKTRRFKDQTPIQVITSGGLQGLVEIRKHLDCSYDWFNDDN